MNCEFSLGRAIMHLLPFPLFHSSFISGIYLLANIHMLMLASFCVSFRVSVKITCCNLTMVLGWRWIMKTSVMLPIYESRKLDQNAEFFFSDCKYLSFRGGWLWTRCDTHVLCVCECVFICLSPWSPQGSMLPFFIWSCLCSLTWDNTAYTQEC